MRKTIKRTMAMLLAALIFMGGGTSLLTVENKAFAESSPAEEDARMATKGMTVFTQNGEDFTINDPNVANEFSTGMAYAIGDHVTYQGNLYVFTAAHSAGAWNAAHVTQVTIGGELKEKEQEISDLKSAIAYRDGNFLYSNIELVTGEYYDDTDGSAKSGAPTYSRAKIMPTYGFNKLRINIIKGNRYNAFYNEDGSFLQNLTTYDGENEYEIPEGATYFGISGQIDSMNAIVIKGLYPIDDRYFRGNLGNYYNISQVPDEYKDFDNLPINMLIGYRFDTDSSIKHTPYDGFCGNVLTIGPRPKNSKTEEFINQLAFGTHNNIEMYFRKKYASWSKWKKIAFTDEVDVIKPSISMFQKIGVVGDSFASGCVFDRADNSGGDDNYPLSWVQNIARRNGIAAENFSHGGVSARTWLADARGLAKLNSAAAQDLYIIALGINDVYTIAVNESDYYQNSDEAIENQTDTMCGNLAKIVSAIKTKNANALIVFININVRIDTREAFAYYIGRINQSIAYVANYYNIPMIDQAQNDYLMSDNYINGFVAGHPDAVGYSGMSVAFEYEIEKILNTAYFNNYPY